MALLTAAPRYEYTLIDCCSKDDIPFYFKLMNKFSIPYVAVYDRNHQEHKSINATASASISTQKIENEINADIGSSVVLINDIVEELEL